jgi:hypothetical protein
VIFEGGQKVIMANVAMLYENTSQQTRFVLECKDGYLGYKSHFANETRVRGWWHMACMEPLHRVFQRDGMRRATLTASLTVFLPFTP